MIIIIVTLPQKKNIYQNATTRLARLMSMMKTGLLVVVDGVTHHIHNLGAGNNIAHYELLLFLKKKKRVKCISDVSEI